MPPFIPCCAVWLTQNPLFWSNLTEEIKCCCWSKVTVSMHKRCKANLSTCVRHSIARRCVSLNWIYRAAPPGVHSCPPHWVHFNNVNRAPVLSQIIYHKSLFPLSLVLFAQHSARAATGCPLNRHKLDIKVNFRAPAVILNGLLQGDEKNGTL